MSTCSMSCPLIFICIKLSLPVIVVFVFPCYISGLLLLYVLLLYLHFPAGQHFQTGKNYNNLTKKNNLCYETNHELINVLFPWEITIWKPNLLTSPVCIFNFNPHFRKCDCVLVINFMPVISLRVNN